MATTPPGVEASMDRWQGSAGAQRTNDQLFLSEFADLRGVPDLARRFQGAPRGDRLPAMLRTLVALGQAREVPGNRFSA
jgi:hypothetical protein